MPMPKSRLELKNLIDEAITENATTTMHGEKLEKHGEKLSEHSQMLRRLDERTHYQGILLEQMNHKLDLVIEVVLDTRRQMDDFRVTVKQVESHEVRLDELETTVKELLVEQK